MNSKSALNLSGLSLAELQELAQDIRQLIISTCLKNGGHLGASLGTVELAIALHRVFHSPVEPIFWDIGHQAYAHKLLTGRWNAFGTLRTTGGISGFLSRKESEHDLFGAGHSSTALSAGLAAAWVRGRSKEPKRWTTVVVGDGALTAGLALEALNNTRALTLGPMLVLLNDNQWSISANVGAIPAILRGGKAAEFFESMGLDYVGPVDGHDLPTLLSTLENIRSGERSRPVLLHALTEKGKGYGPAEESPAAFHGVSPVARAKAEKPSPKKSYSQAFSDAICALAEKDPRVVAVTAAMAEGTGLSAFAERFPDRFFDVGIAEPHAAVFAAGLAAQGLRPVVAIYSTFMQRALDGLIHDIALQELPVTFALDRAGLVGQDGPTHHGAFDIGYTRIVPGLKVMAPSCLGDLPVLLKRAVQGSGPSVIRFPRGGGPTELGSPIEGSLRWHLKSNDPTLIVVALGTAGARIEEALRQTERTQDVSAVSSLQCKPIPEELLCYLEKYPEARLLVVEEAASPGSFGEGLAAARAERRGTFERVSLGDEFVPHGSVADLEASLGLDPVGLAERIRKALL